jgi:hypothetical protein
MAEASTPEEISVFQSKYNEFVEDVMGAIPECYIEICAALKLDPAVRIQRFQEEVKLVNTMRGANTDNYSANPGTILPGVTISDTVWSALSETTKKAVWEHIRILSICCFMESGFGNNTRPDWMEDAMNDMKKKLADIDFSSIIGKFMNFFQFGGQTGAGMPDLKGMFENGFPKLPERFAKGHIARLAQEMVKDITPDDLGITPEMLKDCEKDPSRAFDIMITTFSRNPDMIQKTIMRIGKRLQQKVQMGVIRPQEIAREAEELMKEFAGHGEFVDMLGGLKTVFGMEDMEIARKAGKEGTARMAIARDRLRKKLEKRKQNTGNTDKK